VLVYLVRHAPAGEHDPKQWPDDSRRPLTPRGARKFARAAAGLRQLAEMPEVVLASPFVRAWETAAILEGRSGWPAPRASDLLSSGRSAEDGLTALRELTGDGPVALVGHEPIMGELASLLLTGDTARLNVPFRKGAVACLDLPGNVVPGTAALVWLATPGLLRRIR